MAEWTEPPAQYRWQPPRFRPSAHVVIYDDKAHSEARIISVETRYAWDFHAYHIYHVEIIGQQRMTEVSELWIRPLQKAEHA